MAQKSRGTITVSQKVAKTFTNNFTKC